eukprot:CAMPEP_0119123360 /NCGR_PEP_ID=MMETSP1310-20130426/3327_1 /TAXON_ID=464262 /ORGANISM="Genus nov. species nov., Strain RCC2339" /LENGTH=872 /DNA_ID=CAMNT_0007113155 /DNA_START=23 /DNA_END=2637 /DNA_ORIENTATION=+
MATILELTQKPEVRKHFKRGKTRRPFYSGGQIALRVTTRVEKKRETVAEGEQVVELCCVCENDVVLYDLESGGESGRFAGDSQVLSFAVDPIAKRGWIVTSASSLRFQLWDPHSRKPIRTWAPHRQAVFTMAFDKSGTLLASGGADREVQVWDIEKDCRTHAFHNHQGVVTVVRFSRSLSNLHLLSGAEDSSVMVYDLHTSQPLFKLDNHMSMITTIAHAGRGRGSASHVVTAGADRVLSVYNTKSEFSLSSTIPVFQTVREVLPLSDAEYMLLTGKNVPARKGGEGEEEGGSKKEGKKENEKWIVLLLGDSGTLSFWDIFTAKKLHEVEYPTRTPIRYGGTKFGVREKAFLFTANEETLLRIHVSPLLPSSSSPLSSSKKKKKKNSRPQSATSPPTHPLSLSYDTLCGFLDDIYSVRYVTPSKVLLATNNNSLMLYNLSNGHISFGVGHKDIPLCLDYKKVEGRHLVLSGAKDNTVRLWSVGAGETKEDEAEDGEEYVGNTISELFVGAGHTEPVGCVALANKTDNFFVSASRDKTIKLWKKEGEGYNPHQTRIGHDKDINAVVVAPNDRLVASASQDSSIKLWSVPDMRDIYRLKGHKRGVWSLAFSPVDKILASGGADGTIRLWSLSDYSQIRVLQGHESAVLSCSFLTFGMQLVSGSAYGAIKLWTLKSGENVSSFDPPHDGKVWDLDVQADGEAIISCGADATVVEWQDATIEEFEKSAKLAEEEVLKLQELDNHLLEGDYGKAFSLALEINRPRKALQVLEVMSMKERRIVLGKLDLQPPLVVLLFSYCKMWNTHSRNTVVVHQILESLFSKYHPNVLLRMFAAQQESFKELLTALEPYTDRHYKKTQELLQNSYSLSYILQQTQT